MVSGMSPGPLGYPLRLSMPHRVREFSCRLRDAYAVVAVSESMFTRRRAVLLVTRPHKIAAIVGQEVVARGTLLARAELGHAGLHHRADLIVA